MIDEAQLKQGPARFFTTDHRECDELWAKVEAAVEAGDAEAAEAFGAFDAVMKRHFAMEEEVLFPAFESATGFRGGPTAVMRAEHQQMRGVLEQMAQAATQTKWEQVLDHGDTLMMIIQQHNMKEEGMLYPMCEAHLGGAWPDLAARLASY